MFVNACRMKVGGALIALLQAPALPAYAADDSQWYSARAKLFSQVCMRAAPSFDGFDRLAREAGFKDWNGELLFEPEVVVSLQQHGEACNCYMTVGAPDQTTMVTEIFERLIADYPDAWKPASKKGVINDMLLIREGVEAQVVMKPFTSDGKPWIAANLSVKGACPK